MVRQGFASVVDDVARSQRQVEDERELLEQVCWPGCLNAPLTTGQRRGSLPFLDEEPNDGVVEPYKSTFLTDKGDRLIDDTLLDGRDYLLGRDEPHDLGLPLSDDGSLFVPFDGPELLRDDRCPERV